MVVLNRIYTRTGDGGETSLGNGVRVPKTSMRIEAYGTVDEANSAIGIARCHVTGVMDVMLKRIQNDLFDLGADLAVPVRSGEAPGKALRIADVQVERLEGEIDLLNAHLSPLTSFVLPGGVPGAAHLHLARTIARRAERQVVALAQSEPVSEAGIRYLNRLSDFLFVAARFVNDKGEKDVLWVPGANRSL
ncbi:MAG: cob(I)yrinic acid a,c-diamide adenosyltransferase [Alphaproteobacteria bacterium]|nr:cob(I)yrinic acid a,c-diamide adenosyltransferase [Alphaproteobacteria bacterium]